MVAKKGYFRHPKSGVVHRRCRGGRGPVVVLHSHLQILKYGKIGRKKQAERLKVLGHINGKPYVRRVCEIAGGGCSSETRGTCLLRAKQESEEGGPFPPPFGTILADLLAPVPCAWCSPTPGCSLPGLNIFQLLFNLRLGICILS